MRARQIIDGAAFGPEALKVIGQAFDAAWAEIADNLAETRSLLRRASKAGGRIQRNKTTARDTYDPLAPQGFLGVEGLPLDQSETNHAWHLGVEHKLVPGVTLLGRMAQSFRVANIDERIGSALFGVPTDFDLRTQKSDDSEAASVSTMGNSKSSRATTRCSSRTSSNSIR